MPVMALTRAIMRIIRVGMVEVGAEEEEEEEKTSWRGEDTRGFADV
jgi:hypothetical protein